MGMSPDNRDVKLCFDGDYVKVYRPEQKRVPLANGDKIHRFAQIWQKMFENHDTIPYDFFVKRQFLAVGLDDLGFKLNFDTSFAKAYPGVDISDPTTRDSFLAEVDDIHPFVKVLGEEIYRQWRYWSQAKEKMNDKDFQWFANAFSLLAKVAGAKKNR